MSKWTLDKILECDEIQTGCHFSVSNKECKFHGNNIVVFKTEGAIRCYNELHNGLILISNPSYDVSYFCFRKIDGTEILPPKDKLECNLNELLEAAKPLIKYLNEHKFPYGKAIVDIDTVQLLDVVAQNITKEFIKD